MTTHTDDPEAAARATLALLETRLHRVEFLLSGASNNDGVPPAIATPRSGSETLRARLEALEAGLAKLKRLAGTPGTVIRDIERLDLFAPTVPAHKDVKSEELSTLASIVLAHASLYPETASRLSSLQTLHVPPAEQSSELVSLVPRLRQLDREEQRLQDEARELRERSARCLEWWVKVGVVGMGDVWQDWEKRMADVERHVIRWERRAKEEQGYL
ncbi:putative nuclear distribution protein RO10 [Cladophialophora carrionii]|uniref:Putative nuclear distribution protein RO10 n=1 Tax=Cladophialophora carrionii TaxID=86049 RepID=A0A1C1CQH8_9EURO|nr:putative nuclear distribution protein RO10 [Cladophialophora carrionii]